MTLKKGIYNQKSMANVKWRYVPLTKSNGPTPRPRHGHRAVAIDNKIIVMGGGNEGIVDELHVYNTKANEWSEPHVSGQVPENGVAAFGIAAHGHNIYIHGGMMEYCEYSNEMFMLNTHTWEWTHINITNKDTVCPRLGHSFTLVGTTMYTFGGLGCEVDDQNQFIPRYLNDIYTIDISHNEEGSGPTWSHEDPAGDAPCPRESHTCVCTKDANEKSGALYIFGGMSSKAERMGDLWRLDLAKMIWIPVIAIGLPPLPRSLHTANVIGNKMYIFGGWVAINQKSKNKTVFLPEKEYKCTNSTACFNMDTITWEPVYTEGFEDALPRSRAGHASAVVNSRLYIISGRDGYHRAYNNQTCFKDMWFLETDKPPIPNRVQLIRASTSTLEICWIPVVTADAYLLQIQRLDNSDVNEWYDVAVVKGNSLVVSHHHSKPSSEEVDENKPIERLELSPGTTYRFRIAAINACGRGEFSEPAAFKTCVPGFPGAPSSIRISKGNDGAHLAWDPPANSNGNISEYSVYLAIKNSQSTESPSSLAFVLVYRGDSPSCTVKTTSLQNAHVDQTNKPAIIFRIAAKNEKGYGPATQVRWLQDTKTSSNKRPVDKMS
ncbi:host cell factor 1-like [Bolinopsis microptera]|uniref:host cell factor 1-like n=1 Tax=Bolinopsis microptera TaxID=2820187 RepID=UPI00307A58F1